MAKWAVVLSEPARKRHIPVGVMGKPPRQSDSNHLSLLTIWRFVAALAIVIHHILAGHLPIGIVRNLALCGFVAVSFFFVLSGYILTYVYSGTKVRVPCRPFWIARFARIYPLYLLSCFACLPFLESHIHNTAGAVLTIVATLTMTQAWFPGAATAWNPVAWTLSVEVFFYLLFPMLLDALEHLSKRCILELSGVIWLTTLFPALLYTSLWPDALRSDWVFSGTPFWLGLIEQVPVLHLGEFLIGIAAARLVCEGTQFILTPYKLWTVRLGAASTVLLVMAQGTGVSHALLKDGLLAPVFAALIATTAISGQVKGTLEWVWRTAVLLGEASYALYLFHLPIWGAITLVFPGVMYMHPWSFAGVFVLFMLTVLAISVGLHCWIERPSRQLIRALFQPARIPLQ